MKNEFKAELEQLRQFNENELNTFKRQAKEGIANIQPVFANIHSM